MEIELINGNLLASLHRQAGENERLRMNYVNWVDFRHDSTKQTSSMALAAPKIENFVKNF